MLSIDNKTISVAGASKVFECAADTRCVLDAADVIAD
jgi:hypothetical protein